MRPWKILICLLLLLAVGKTLIQPPLPVYASASDNALDHDNVVRVFFPLQKGFAELDESGGFRGYNYDFLMDIAQLTGWRYEFVTAEQTNENIQSGLDEVKSGELDLVCSMTRTPELEADYLYSSKPYGTVQYTLAALESNRGLNNRTISGFQNLRIALVEKAKVQNRLLDDYCKENRIQYQPIYAQSNAECQLLVENGQADVLITKDVVFLSGYKTIVKFSSQSFYFATGKGNSELLQELDDALSSILSATPELQEQRHRQYFTKPSDYALRLTESEYAYLEQAPALQVAVLTERAPIQDYDSNTGEFSGAMVDILSLLSQKSGLCFELIPADSRDHAMDMINEGKADLMAGMPYSYSDGHSDSYDLLLTSPILTLPIVRAGTLRAEPEHTELLVYSDTKLFMDRDDILYQDDLQEILSQIEAGAYAEAYVDGYIAQHYQEQEGFKNVSLSLTPYGNYPVCLGVSRKVDLRLISILEQTIASLTPDEVEAILYQNTSHSHQTSFYDLLKRNPVPFILGALFIFLLVSALLLALLMKTRHLNRIISAEKTRYKTLAQTDGLTQLLNNASFRTIADKHISAASPGCGGALLILDIDHFKKINDNFGHLAGDEALCSLAGLLQTTFRAEDVLGRIGGDEFAVLFCGITDKDIVLKRCRQLLTQCHAINNRFEITLSIGGSIFLQDAEFEALFSQADEALYEVKHKGRNGVRINAYRERKDCPCDSEE